MKIYTKVCLRKPLTTQRLREHLRRFIRSLSLKNRSVAIMTKVFFNDNSYKSLSKRKNIYLQDRDNITQYINNTIKSYSNKLIYAKYDPQKITKLVFDCKKINKRSN